MHTVACTVVSVYAPFCVMAYRLCGMVRILRYTGTAGLGPRLAVLALSPPLLFLPGFWCAQMAATCFVAAQAHFRG